MRVRGRQAARRRSAKPPSLRIIGGQWRGRKLTIADAPGLRPTPNRIRETLFNWLAPLIDGARCIDLFAGTGSLGIEALSRGAAEVSFIEHDRDAARALESALATLGANNRGRVIVGDMLRAAADPSTDGSALDIVFIDPPFDARLHGAALAAVDSMIGPDTRIYLEYPATAELEVAALLVDNYECLRRGRAASVGFCLARRRGAGEHKSP